MKKNPVVRVYILERGRSIINSKHSMRKTWGRMGVSAVKGSKSGSASPEMNRAVEGVMEMDVQARDAARVKPYRESRPSCC